MEHQTEQQKPPLKDSFLEKIFERLLETSGKFRQFRIEFEELVVNVGRLAQTIINLSQALQNQQQSLSELYEIQDRLIKQLSSNKPDSQFPLKAKKENEKLN